MYTERPSLRERVNAKLAEQKKPKSMLAAAAMVNRAVMSNYLNNKPVNMSEERLKEMETWLENWLIREGEAACYVHLVDASSEEYEVVYNKSEAVSERRLAEKPGTFESGDFLGVMGLCTLCQENQELGIVVGRSGFGKTYTLKYYARIPKVVHIECNETMNCKDIVRKIERKIGLPKGNGSIDERMEHIYDFFNTNQGYLLIIDEADKLISKYTIKKIELIRNIADCCSVGIVLAGEPSLESSLKAYDNRFANRMDLIYKLKGLNKKEVECYFKDFEVDDDAMKELHQRACNTSTGCFRLLDRTLNNILRILKNSDKTQITYKVIAEASSMMIL